MTKVSKAPLSRAVRLDCCHRCGGLMVPEQVHELGGFDWHCVSCGERIDPVILEHRRREKFVHGKAEAGLESSSEIMEVLEGF